jgi:quercetin dioxygenase-like cupin family protein
MPFIDPRALPEIEPKPGWHGRFFHSEHITMAYYQLDPGASLHAHAHVNEEIWNVVEGELELTLGGETRTVAAGCAVVVPSGITHSVIVWEPCRVIVVDHPRRDEIAGKKI